MAEKWIAGATKNKGAFTKQANAVGKSPAAFQAQVLAKGSKASTKTKKRAALRKTLVGMMG